jgi:hypothetical protein
MLFCRTCGQCLLIDEDCTFYEYRDTAGWEKNQISAEDGDFIEYMESETTDSSFTSYECGNCCGEDIDSDWDGSIEEAQEIRDEYLERQRLIRENRERESKEIELRKKATDPNREWDMSINLGEQK